jgi:glycosyltransferase involved in cell wall biosynthesis
MRLGIVCLFNANAFYRAVYPLQEMERRGHEVVWPDDFTANPDIRVMSRCDVVHVYRRADDEIRPLLSRLVKGGTPFTYDNDDDFSVIPKESPSYDSVGGRRGRRYFTATTKVARLARAFTTTSESLAEKYRRAGVTRIEVIGNHLPAGALSRPRRHRGIVIGWVAAHEHQVDAQRIPIAEALQRVLAKHDDVRVECIGVDLGLQERYRHDETVPFEKLQARIRNFDVGIAPLADIPMNHARSDVKLKEYAAAGVPWLASPVGPYVGLGEAQGGRLVPNDGWFEAIDELVSGRRERKRLARTARSWANSQTVAAVADRWERVFLDAAA